MRSSRAPSRSIFHGLALKYRAFKYSARRKLLPQVPATGTMLEALPIEIIELIASDLMIHDLVNLRLTCHRIHAKTNDYFGRNSFQTISTDLSRRELHWLSNSLVKNQQLANAVKLLCIEAKYENRGLGHDYHWNRRGQDNDHLISPCDRFGDGFEALLELFDHFPRCNTVQVYAKNIASEEDTPNDRLHTTDAVQILLLLATVRDLRISMLELGSPKTGIYLDAACLPVETLNDSNVKSMLASLTSFSIRLIYSDDIIASGWLSTVFEAFVHLNDLALDLDMSWGEAEVMNSLIDKLKCMELKNLRLSRFKTSMHILDTFIVRSRSTLTSVSLYGITIVSTQEEAESPWKSWLALLHRNLPQLRYIDLDQLSTVQSSNGRSHLHFSSLLPLVEQAGHISKTPHDRTFRFSVPPIDGRDVQRMSFEITSHGWQHQSQLVLSGVKYNGTEMAKALEFLQEHAEEMSII